MHKKRHFLLSASLNTPLFLALLAINSSAHSAEASANNKLEHITVTATRSPEQRVAASLASIDNIEFYQANHINEVAGQSPGTWISRGNGQEHLTAIRSPVLTGGGSCASFYMAEDNVPLRAPAFCNVNQLIDSNYEQAQRIEVLRGPGTAFQGNSAMHGIINIISPNFTSSPSTDLSAMGTSLGMGRLSVDHRDSNWMLQTHVDKDNGYKDDSGYEQQKLRFKVLQEGDNWTLTHALNVANLDQDTAGYVEGKDAYKDPDRKKENGNPEAFRKAKSLRFSSELRLQTNDHSELIFTPYARTNSMDFLMHFQPGMPLEENGHNSLGFQSAYITQINPAIKLSAGVDMDYSKGFLKQTQSEADKFGKFPQGQHYDYDVAVLDASVFSQVDAQLAENWQLTLGLRLQQSYYDCSNNLSDGSACDSSMPECRYYRPASDTQSFFNWSPHANIQYQLASDNFAYFSVSRGYRAPHTSDLYRLEMEQASADIDSEQLDSAEFGFNGLLADNIAYQLSVYAMKKDNVIVKTNERERADGQKTKHHGVEFNMDYQIIDSLRLSMAMSYAKHQYDSDVQLLNSGTEFIKGNDIDTAPRQMHNLQLSWTPTNSSEFQIEGIYMDDYYMDAANTFSYEGHTLTNLRYSQQLPQGWAVQLAVINTLDVDYAERADITFGSKFNPSEERYFIGEPRNIRLTINKQF